jgi:hypothetical protein
LYPCHTVMLYVPLTGVAWAVATPARLIAPQATAPSRAALSIPDPFRLFCIRLFLCLWDQNVPVSFVKRPGGANANVRFESKNHADKIK